MKNNDKLLYQGHASVRIVTAEKKVIYIDPFAGKGYDLAADLILVTHAHFDHCAVGMVRQRPDCRIISFRDALEGGGHKSFDLGYVKVESVEAGNNKNHSIDECVGFILTLPSGVTLYFSGDTSKVGQMESLAEKNIDYAFFCCDGVYNMNGAEAAECARLVKAKHNIPYHVIATDSGKIFDFDAAERFTAPNLLLIEPKETIILEKS